MDFPPDTYLHFLKNPTLDLSAVKHILITHSHEDHFYPEDMLLNSPCFSSTVSVPIHIYGNATVISRMASYIERAPGFYQAKEFLCLHLLEPFHTASIGDYAVTPVLADHDKAEACYLYVIEQGGKTLLYGNDTGILLREETWTALKKFHYDLVSMDCTACLRDVPGGHHMGLPNNLEMAQRLTDMGCISERTQFVITHFSHHYAPFAQRLSKNLPAQNWTVAFDGMRLCV